MRKIRLNAEVDELNLDMILIKSNNKKIHKVIILQ